MCNQLVLINIVITLRGNEMKIITAKLYKNFKNLRLKLLKTNAAIWFNKVCRAKGLQPKYISIHSKGRSKRDTRTTQQAVKNRINQEIKFLYKRKQHFNQQFYRMHLEGATMFEGMWPHASSNTEAGCYEPHVKIIIVLTSRWA